MREKGAWCNTGPWRKKGGLIEKNGRKEWGAQGQDGKKGKGNLKRKAEDEVEFGAKKTRSWAALQASYRWVEARPMRALPFQEIGLNEPLCARPFPHRCVPRKSEGCEGRRKLLFPGNFRRPLRLWKLLWSVAQLCCAVYRWKLNISTPWPTTAKTICNTTKSGQRTGKSLPRLPCWVHRYGSTHPMQSSVVIKRMHGRRFNPFRKYLMFEWPPMTVFIWLITRVCIMTISAASRSKSFMLHTQTIWKFAKINESQNIYRIKWINWSSLTYFWSPEPCQIGISKQNDIGFSFPRPSFQKM